MPLSWNEIKNRAVLFARSWCEASRERAEAQTFWNEFFDVFGISRRKVASFEEPVKNLRGGTEYIDLFWKGRLIAEHKSRGRDLGKAHTQAIGYVQGLINEGRGDEAPQYILVSDFARFALHNLEETDRNKQTLEFDLAEFPNLVREFAFIAGYERRKLDPEDPANFRAVELLGNLHDQLEAGGYRGHPLEQFLVRILFCLFADDTAIFEPDTFTLYIETQTREDAADLGAQLSRFFGVLNTPKDERQANLGEELAALPYVNGELFSEHLGFAEFNSAMRNALLACCHFKWNRISPAIFGSLFQAVMQPRERRQIGAHYTSERDILKLINSLFLDDLKARLESAEFDQKKLRDLHDHIASLKFLDPACGCGNFLVITYRELRRLETEILRQLYSEGLSEGDLRAECRVDVDQMHGIEIEEWPARIAEVAMWLMDHQMNQEVFQVFGKPLMRLPLRKSAKIAIGNALRMDWKEVLAAEKCSYVMGNPPFVGKQFATDEQKSDLGLIFGAVKGAGVLDYVTAWYMRASEYVQGTSIRCAFVSTSSITQGEQVGVLWTELFRRGVKIHFGHRTFAWESEARGKAHVHVVIVGFGFGDAGNKRIYDYSHDLAAADESIVRNISPYLVEGNDVVVVSRSRPLCDVPEIVFGNMPNDGGHLLLTDEDRRALLARHPGAAKFIRRLVGSHEFINGESRWCLWLVDASPAEIRDMPDVQRRVDAVREHRAASPRETTRKLAARPALFGELRQPAERYLLVPSVSSETRTYIPMGFMHPSIIASNLALMVPSATLYHFGVLSSRMHMAWVRHVCGRLESRYRYSNRLVYNNFAWPSEVSDKQREKIEAIAQRVLDARVECGDGRAGFLPVARPAAARCTLADLYDPLVMPLRLIKAHEELDRAVDRCYRRQAFGSERQRVEFLFGLYEKLIAPLTASAPRR